jgi:WD40 repeat protein
LAVQNFSAGGGSKAIAIAFTRDGSLLASAHEDGTIQIRDARAGLLTRLIDARGAPAPSLAFDRRGNRLAAAGPDPAVRIWDLRDGRLVESRTHAGSGSRLIAFSPNGDRVVTTADNGLVTLHDLSAGRPATVLRGMPLLAFAPQVNKVAGLAFSPDGRRLLAARTHSWLNLWDTQSLQRFKDIEVRLGYLAPPAISPDGRRIAVAGGSNEDSEVAVLDADSGEVVQRLKGHSFPISAVTFSPDGRRIVTGSWDRLIKVWDAGSGQELLSLKGHFDSVTMLEFGHGGRRLASLDRAGTIILWDSHALDTPENRAEREAIGLIRHLKLNSSSPDDFKAAVRHTGALSDRARTKALEFAEIALRADTEARADALVNRMAAVSGDDRDVTFAICAEPVPERIRTRALEMAARLDDDPRRFTRRDPENDPREYPNAGQAAYAWASRAGRLLPSDGNCQHILGFAAFRAGHIDEALAAFRRAATLNHNQPSDLAAIAIVQFKRGALSEARSALAQARSAMKSPRFSTDELARNLIKTAQDLDDQSKH